MQDLAELARQSFLARYEQVEEPSTNGHRKSGRRNRGLVICISCENEIKSGIRYRFRIDQQTKGRKWQHTGLEVFYICPGCHITMKGLILGGY